MKNMKRILCALISVVMLMGMLPVSVGASPAANPAVQICGQQVEYMENPMGIDVEKPRFSWRMEADERGQCQTAYQLLVASAPSLLTPESTDVWDSGKVDADASVGIVFGGTAAPRTRYYWKVLVWDKDGACVQSDVAWWETGLMGTGWNNAEWIGANTDSDTGYQNLTTFTIEADYEIKDTAFSLIFGAQDENNFYMQQISASAFRNKDNGLCTVRPHKWTNGQGACLETKKIDASVYSDRANALGTKKHLKIEVTNGNIKTFIGDVLIDDRTVAPFKLGKVGFRTAHNDRSDVNEHEQFYVDNLIVKDANGAVVFSDGFDDLTNFPGAGTISSGRLYMTYDKLVLQSNQSTQQAAPTLRRSFELQSEKQIERARLYATAAGIYNFYINGEPVSADYFNPGRTTLTKRVMYQTFDVTGMLKIGKNAMGAVLGKGWYNLDKISAGGNYISLYAQLIVDYTDGTSETIVTDGDWKYTGNGPVLQNNFWQGETYDARRELGDWSSAEYNDAAWKQAGVAAVRPIGGDQIVAQVGPTVTNTMTLSPISVSEPEEHVFVYDFGQNFAGTVRLHVKGTAGTKIRLRYAEMLNDGPKGTRGNDGNAGTVYQANLRSAKNTDYYILKGDEAGETFEPSLVYHGFRYLEITGIDEALPLSDVQGVVLSSVGDTTSTFSSSNPLVNKLYSNTVWGERSNFLSVPTDCPQRDERRGFTGDAQIFARTATYNMDVAAFLEKYMQDICDNQTADGAFPHMAPSLDGYVPKAGGWMDAGIIIPWQLYQQYVDQTILEKYYDNMSRYIDYLVNSSVNGIRNKTAYGDWLNIGEETQSALLDTAFCVYSSDLMAKIAAVLEKEDDAAKFSQIATQFRTAWQKEFVNADGTLKKPTQTGYALGLAFDIFKPEDRETAGAALVKKIADNGWHLSTGFCGVSYLAPALSSAGHTDTAYRLLEQESYPSWLYPVLQGATTNWERWNSYTIENGFGDASMNSFNHYAYGSVMEWVYRNCLGIERDETAPGYKHIILQPELGGNFTYMNGSYDSIYGTIFSGWEKQENAVVYTVSVPANTTATLSLEKPAAAYYVLEGDGLASQAVGVTEYTEDGEKITLELQSGDYRFTVCNYDSSVDDLIEAIGKVTLDSEESITKARAAYDGLTPTAKLGVKKYDVLLSAEREYALLCAKSTLEASVTAAEQLKKSDYTAESWTSFETALNAAKAVLADDNATQDEVDAARTALETAIAGLKEAVDWTALDAAIADAEARNLPGTYCKDELAVMNTALTAAKTLRQNPNATHQQAADALASLTAAMGALKPHTSGPAATEEQPQTCTNCGYVLHPELGHQHVNHLTPVAEKAATCKEQGNIAYWSCSCSKLFADENAATELTAADVVTEIDPSNHVGGTEIRDARAATEISEGYTGDSYCLGCGNKIAEGHSIPKLTPAPAPVTPVTPSEPASDPFNPNAGANTAKFPFTDVPSNSWYYSSVKAAWENDLIDGVTANEFKPNATLTVAQTIKLAAALHQLDRTGEVSLKNGGANWYDSYVNYAVVNGIIEKDYANYTKAQMNAPVTRGEFVHIFHGTEEAYKAINTVADNAIPDVKTTDKFAAEIYEFYRAGILTGSDAKGTFHSASTIKRSEAAAILLRMFEASARKSITLN